MFRRLDNSELLELAFDAERRINNEEEAMALIFELALRLREAPQQGRTAQVLAAIFERDPLGDVCEGRR